MKTTVKVFGKLVELEVKEVKTGGYQPVVYNSYLDSKGKLVKTGKFCPVKFVKGW